MNDTMPPGGLMRLDSVAVREDEESPDYRAETLVLARIRTASSLGPPLTPFTILDWGTPEQVGGTSWQDPDLYPVLAVRGGEALTGVDVTGYRTTRTRDPYVVAGSPLVSAHPRPEWAYLAYGGSFDASVLTSIESELITTGPWRAATDEASLDRDAVREALRLVGHPPGGEDPFDRAYAAIDEWRADVDALLADASHACLAEADLGTAGAVPPGLDPAENPGVLTIGFGAWLTAMGADPAAAAVLGQLTALRLVVPHPERRGIRMLGAVGLFAVPRDSDVQTPAHRLALTWSRQSSAMRQRQDEALALLRTWHTGLDECMDGLRDTQEFVCLWAPGVVAPLPDPPAAPGLVGGDPVAADGSWRTRVVVSGHQGGPVLADRHDSKGSRSDTFLLPASGEIVDSGWTARAPDRVRSKAWVQDPWGQWSQPSHATVDLPETLPAAPSVTLEFEPVVPPEDRAPEDYADTPAAPGVVTVRAFAADPPLGGRPVTAMTAFLTEASVAQLAMEPDAQGRWWTAATPVRATTRGETVHVRADVVATAGLDEVPATPRTITIRDPRPVLVRATSPALLFTGPRRPDGTVEADLRVPRPAAPADATYRLYVADEAAFGAAPSVGTPRYVRVRALLADGLTRRRTRYVLLPGRPVTAAGDDLRLRVVLPGRSDTLRLLQLVTVTAGGIETPDALSSVFVLGVPLDDVPATPSLEVRPTPGRPRAFDVTVSVTHPRGPEGTPPLSLRRRGLSQNAPLVARVLWAPAATEPTSAVVARDLALLPDHPPAGSGVWRWTATRTLGLPTSVSAYTRLRLWARAAWPSEPAAAPDADTSLGSVQGFWATPAEQPGEWGPLSAGVEVLAGDSGQLVGYSGVFVPGADTTVRVTLASADPGNPGWRVVIRSDRGDQLTSTGPQQQHLFVVPASWPQDPATWRVSVTNPDGKGRPVFDLGSLERG